MLDLCSPWGCLTAYIAAMRASLPRLSDLPVRRGCSAYILDLRHTLTN